MRISLKLTSVLVFMLLLGFSISACQRPAAQRPGDTNVTVERTDRTIIDGQRRVARQPNVQPYSENRVSDFELPEGFQVSVYATNLENPRKMTSTRDGFVYVAQPDDNSVVMLRDINNDGIADQQRIVVEDLDNISDIASHENTIYFATNDRIYQSNVLTDGSLSRPEIVTEELPDNRLFRERSLAVGPDGMIYVSIGTEEDANRVRNVVQQEDELGSLLAIDPETGEQQVYARGMRNVEGLAWNPETRDLWGTDMMASAQAGDRLNRISQDRHYGWPHCPMPQATTQTGTTTGQAAQQPRTTRPTTGTATQPMAGTPTQQARTTQPTTGTTTQQARTTQPTTGTTTQQARTTQPTHPAGQNYSAYHRYYHPAGQNYSAYHRYYHPAGQNYSTYRSGSTTAWNDQAYNRYCYPAAGQS
jgi:glucose/arabinose dehydrogenase